MKEKVDVFVCSLCGYEDSSFIPSGAILSGSKNCRDGCVICPHCGKEVLKEIVQKDFEPYMSIQEFNELLNYIHKNHSFKDLKGKMIKYISPTIDFRTGCIGKIVIDDVSFNKVNENRHRNLKNWVLEYLNS